MTSESTSAGPYRSAARDRFEALKRLYGRNDSLPSGQRVPFWQLGNTFDTMIDFLEVVDPGTAHDVVTMAVKQLNLSLKRIGGGWDGAWFDDFGWWSVATQRAIGKPFFEPDVAPLRKILSNCWSRFSANAPFVWERRAPGTFDAYGPAVDGGVWNSYWRGTPSTHPGPKDGDPSSGSLIGIQNTVTNALFLMAAQRLGRTDPAIREIGQRELRFVESWLAADDRPLWWTLGDDAGLVRERVGHFAAEKPALGYQEEWAWTGDQGLILGCLGDAARNVAPNFREPLLARARALLSGVVRHVTDDGVVRSWTATGRVPDGDSPDYATGTGVFWRNVLYVWSSIPELRTFLSRPENQSVVRASADAAARDGDTSIVGLTNQVAALVAAAAMLE